MIGRQSVILHLTLRYTGRDEDEVFSRFARELHAALGDARCADWRM